MINVLITGHRGYLGSELTKLLLENNKIKVIGYDNCLYQNTSKDRNIRDFRDIDFSNLGKIDAVVHLAGISTNYDPPERIYYDLAMKINYEETVKLAIKAKRAGVRKFIFASSASVYGESSKGHVDEKSTPNPLTAYAESKLAAEKELFSLKSKGFNPLILRMVTLFGLSERMRFDVLVNSLILSSLTDGKIVLKSDGQAVRPQVHVKDVCKIYKLIIENDRDDLNGEIINIGREDYNLSVLRIAKRLGNILNCKVIVGEKQTLDNRSYTVDFTRQEELFSDVQFDTDFDSACNEISTYFKKKNGTDEWYNDEIYYNLKRMKSLVVKNKISNDFKFCS